MVVRRNAHVELLLFHVDGLFLQDAGLDGSFVRRPRRLHGHQRIGNFQAHLILELPAPHLGLPELQLIARGVRLGHAVPQRKRQLQTNSVSRIVPTGNLSQCLFHSLQRRREVPGGMVGKRIQISGQAAVLNNADHVEFRPQRVQRTGEADSGVLHLDGGLVQVGPIP